MDLYASAANSRLPRKGAFVLSRFRIFSGTPPRFPFCRPALGSALAKRACGAELSPLRAGIVLKSVYRDQAAAEALLRASSRRA